ncbi:peroxisomal membrane protein pex14 [Gnomoniopsis sp. IMI 355080]|nr:peroxisomal membrane protein pex14 [Gnomoniopsis sp. IMI 355080]
MTIREDLVASADPNVAASPVENRIAFLKAKNLTDEEVQAALSRAAAQVGPAQSYPPPPGPAPGPGQQPAYYGGYPPYGWQPPPPEVPRRDWRDWFIMATVVGGVSYGLYALGKRYVYPLIAPPTPERLEADKKSIDSQFEKAFALVEQLSKDTETLKAAEQQRTEKLDAALAELETVISDLKTSNRRREDEAQRVRDDVSNLKTSIPKALDAQKSLADTRLQEVNAELKSLKTIISQRMQQPSNANSLASRPTSTVSVPTPTSTSTQDNESNGTTNGHSKTDEASKSSNGASFADVAANGRSSPFSSGISPATVKIPEWQRAMASKKSSSSMQNAAADAGSSSQAEAGGSTS